jgi:hypothetical protein
LPSRAVEKCIRDRRAKQILLPLLSPPALTKFDGIDARRRNPVVSAKFDPFGEPVAMADSPSSQRSSWLMRAGTGLFWSLVLAIVLARAIWFDPATIYNGFDRAIAFARGLTGLL